MRFIGKADDVLRRMQIKLPSSFNILSRLQIWRDRPETPAQIKSALGWRRPLLTVSSGSQWPSPLERGGGDERTISCHQHNTHSDADSVVDNGFGLVTIEQIRLRLCKPIVLALSGHVLSSEVDSAAAA